MLKNLKITTKLYLAFSFLGLLTFIVSIIGLNGISNTGDALVEIGNNQFPKLETLLSIQKENLNIRSSLRALLIPNTTDEVREEQYNNISSSKSMIEKRSMDFEKFNLSENEKNLWKNFKESYSAMISNISKFEELSRSAGKITTHETDIYKKMHHIAFSDFRREVQISETALTSLVDFTKRECSELKTASYSDIGGAKSAVIIGSILVVFVSISAGYAISTLTIKKPMKNIITAFEKVIAGDLRDRMSITQNDELGIIGKLVNRVADERKNQILNLLDQATTLNKSSQELLKISEDTAYFSNDLTNKIQYAADSSKQITGNFDLVSTSSGEMTSSIREIAKNTTESSKITEDARDKASVAGEVMNRLGESSTEIGNIIKVITSIAEQTNLLALNATIEAARAGEAGKGFGVVANEVKELAKETSKATEDITNRIKMIQNESQSAIDIISQIIETINRVGDLTNMVATAIEEQSVTTSEIGRNINEALSGTNSIVESNSDIALSSHKFKDLSGGIAKSATELQELADKMEKQLRTRFKF